MKKALLFLLVCCAFVMNAGAQNPDISFRNETTTNITTTSATLTAEINPNGNTVTGIVFQCNSNIINVAAIPADNNYHTVSTTVGGLWPATAYQWSVYVEYENSILSPAYSDNVFFTTATPPPPCTGDASVASGFAPTADNAPCAVKGQAYSQTYTMVVPTQVSGSPVESARINSVQGLPAGLTFSQDIYHATHAAGERFCLLISGTPTGDCGQYLLQINATITTDFNTATGNIHELAQTYNIPNFGKPFMRLVAAGQQCPAVDANQQFNFQAYPTCAATSNVASATTNAASNIGNTAVQLNATVNANNTTINAIAFDWGLSTAYGNTLNATPATASGNSTTAVSAQLNSLGQGATFHYRVKVSPQTGAIIYGDDQSFTTSTNTGISAINNEGFEMYPNPVAEQLFITGSNDYINNATIHITNLEGKVCIQRAFDAGTNAINISELAPGVYAVLITSGSNVYTRKLIVSPK